MEPSESTLDVVGGRLSDALAMETNPAEDVRRARDGFLDQVALRGARASLKPRRLRGRPGRPRWLLLAGALATSATAFYLWPRPPILFRVDTSLGRFGDLVQASAGKTSLTFSEGSSLSLSEGGRVRVLSTSTKGARVLVESGALDASIYHPKGKKVDWTFEAGPFKVAVTGTKFLIDFEPQGEALRLATTEGQVLVSGPCLPQPKPVSAGERIDVSCQGRGESHAMVGRQEPTTARLATLDAADEPLPSAGAGRPGRGNLAWRELLASGRLIEGLRAAERANFENVCQMATNRELLALADGARLFGRPARAIAALRVLRQRFPGTGDAATAAFALGRMAFERQNAYAEAVRWFETYLREQPTGPLMGDAFGRLMEARQRAGDETGARVGAQQYLRRFPEGPYASEARGILSK